MLTKQRQGDLGELSALEWFASIGAYLYVPLGRSPNCDFIVELDGVPLRIQAKTSRRRRPTGTYDVQVCTRGGNQSWSGTSKLFDPLCCDYLFVLVSDGRRWLIPAAEINAKHSILVGGKAYARFEVEAGRPFDTGSRTDAG